MLNEVVIPIKVDAGALKGFFVTLDYISQIKQGYQLDIDVKILFTMVNRNNVDKLTIQIFNKILKNSILKQQLEIRQKP